MSRTAAADAVDTTNTHRLHVPALDGLRFLSFFIVFLSHAGLGKVVPGAFGVTVFFFISGYLITTLLRVEWRETLQVSLRGFYLRRVLRIFPPFYIVLVVSLLLLATGVLSGSVHWWVPVLQALHLTNYLIILEPNARALPDTGVYWSLAVEEHFYLVFPLAYVAMRRAHWPRVRQAKALAAACAVILAWRCFLVFGMHVSFYRTFVGTDTRIDSILFGCILAVWHNPVIDRRSKFEQTPRATWLAGAAGVAFLLISFVVRNPQFRDTLRYSLQGAGLFLIMPSVIRYHDRGLFRLLSNRLIVRGGQLSYSLYLTHLICIDIATRYVGRSTAVNDVCAFVLAWAVCEVLRKFVELPAARLRRRLVAASEYPATPVPAQVQGVERLNMDNGSDILSAYAKAQRQVPPVGDPG